VETDLFPKLRKKLISSALRKRCQETLSEKKLISPFRNRMEKLISSLSGKRMEKGKKADQLP